LGLLLVGTAGLVAFAAWYKTKRPELEDTRQVTAVGDTLYFSRPSEAEAARPILQYKGQEYYAASLKKIGIRDSRMERVAKAGIGEYWLYTPREDLEAEHAGKLRKGQDLFLKLDQHEFLRLQPGKPGK
jgi:hypothetical protein